MRKEDLPEEDAITRKQRENRTRKAEKRLRISESLSPDSARLDISQTRKSIILVLQYA